MSSPKQDTPLAVIRVVGTPVQKRNRPARFDEGKHKPWTALVIAALCRGRLNGKRYTGAFRIDITFYFPRPKNHFRTGRFAGEKKPNAPGYHTKRPDRDNLDKAVLDALTQCGFWVDDAQAAAGEILKFYCPDDWAPGCTITITKLED